MQQSQHFHAPISETVGPSNERHTLEAECSCGRVIYAPNTEAPEWQAYTVSP